MSDSPISSSSCEISIWLVSRLWEVDSTFPTLQNSWPWMTWKMPFQGHDSETGPLSLTVAPRARVPMNKNVRHCPKVSNEGHARSNVIVDSDSFVSSPLVSNYFRTCSAHAVPFCETRHAYSTWWNPLLRDRALKMQLSFSAQSCA